MAEKRVDERDAVPAESAPYSPSNNNQVRQEPIPASHDDDKRQASVLRNEESASPDSAPGAGRTQLDEDEEDDSGGAST
jgi:hypothetical protein